MNLCARALLIAFAGVRLFAQQSATIEIDARRIVHPVPRTVFGGFTEPLRSAIYTGGLWAQLLDNPSFEENLWSASAIVHMMQGRPELAQAARLGLPIPWESLYPQGARFEPRWGDAANSGRSLLVMGLPGKQTGVRQAIYPPVHRVLRYTGSIWAKPVSGGRRIEVSLRRHNRPDEVLAKAPIELTASGWQRYEYALELAKGQLARREPADFAVTVSDEARVLIDQVLLYPADHMDGLNPEAVAMTKALKLPLLRFGGNFTSGYHWRDGVGPMDQRVSMLNQAWGQPEYNHFGTDEFLNFCRLTGTQPQICVNLGSGTVEEAAEWVKYVNAHWGAAGLTWELGNELWGNGQIGYPTLERLAARTREFSQAVRQVDPTAKLIATGEDPDKFQAWNAAQLSSGPGYFEYLAAHLVVDAGGVRKKDPSPEFVAEAMFAMPVGIERLFHDMKNQIDADARMKGRVGIALTEYLFRAPFSSSPPDYPAPHLPEYRNLGGAIWLAGMLNTLIRVADFVPIANLTGAVEFGRLWEKRGITYGVPSYWAFRMYSNADVANLLDTKVEVARYSVREGSPRTPDIADVPYLDLVAVANRTGDTITLFGVNRSLTADIASTIKLTGFSVHSASGTLLAADNIYVGNDDERPEAVFPAEFKLAGSGSTFTHTFPKASITRIELR
jgi:alpha-N-arabinofuranosidase